MKNKIFIWLFAMSMPVTAYSTQKSEYFQKTDKFMKIAIGSPADLVSKNIGKPNSINNEKFPSAEYEVWEYSAEKDRPLAFFTIATKEKNVAGRSIWIYEKDPEYKLDQFLKDYFSSYKFEKFIPCQSHGSEEVLVNSDHGIFIATRDSNAHLISWSDPQLTKLRIAQFYTKCPRLQPNRKTAN